MLPVPISGARWPTKGAGAYLYRRSDIHLHQGVDLPARKGSPVWSVFSGVVETSSPPGARGFDGYGRVVVVRRADGVRAMFAHLDSSLVHEGENVSEGQQIATVGTSRGTVEQPDLQFTSSGAHLHFETSRKPYPMASEGGRIDPLGVEPMPDAEEDKRDSIERWRKLDGLITKLYNAVPVARRPEVQPLLDEWRSAYEAAPTWGKGLRAAAISDWVERYNAARKVLSDAGAAVPPAVRDIGVHQDVADAADAVKDAASGAFSWVVVAALAWLWIESKKNEQVIHIEMERGQ